MLWKKSCSKHRILIDDDQDCVILKVSQSAIRRRESIMRFLLLKIKLKFVEDEKI